MESKFQPGLSGLDCPAFTATRPPSYTHCEGPRASRHLLQETPDPRGQAERSRSPVSHPELSAEPAWAPSRRLAGGGPWRGATRGQILNYSGHLQLLCCPRQVGRKPATQQGQRCAQPGEGGSETLSPPSSQSSGQPRGERKALKTKPRLKPGHLASSLVPAAPGFLHGVDKGGAGSGGSGPCD